MNLKPVLAVATFAVLVQVGLAIFFGTGTTLGVTTGTTALTGATYSVAGVGTLIAGIALLKAIGLVAVAATQRGRRGGRGRGRGGRGFFGRRRGRREIDDGDVAVDDLEEEEIILDGKELASDFGVIAQLEPQQCYRRLICDLATGQMPKSNNDLIMSLFTGQEQVDAASPEFEYAIAAQLGRQFRNVKFCEFRFSCALSGEQLIAATGGGQQQV